MMKNKFMLVLFMLSFLVLVVNSQTMHLNVGNVMYDIPASQAGVMKFSDGTKLTVGEITYDLSKLAEIHIDSVSVKDNQVSIDYEGKSAYVTISGNLAPFIFVDIQGNQVHVETSPALVEEVVYILKGEGNNGSFSLTGTTPAMLIFDHLNLSNSDSTAIVIKNEQPVRILLNNSFHDKENIDFDKDYPDYLKEEYQKTLSDILEVKTKESGLILFSTDLHYSYPGSNYYEDTLMKGIEHMFMSINKLCFDLHPNICVFGGDYVQLPLPDKGLTKEMGFKTLDYQSQQMNNIPIPQFLIIGNHELHYSGSSSSVGMSEEEFYDYIQKKFVDNGTIMEVGLSKQVFYRDDPKAKLRYLFISTPNSSYNDLLNDIKAVAMSTPANYSLIVFNHFAGTAYKEGNYTIYPEVKKCLDVIKESGVDFIAWVGGHNHADMFYEYKEMVVLSCLQSGFWTPDYSDDGILYEHKKEHYSESALSAIVIRKDLGKIYIKRMGRNYSANRMWYHPSSE